ncbi:MAG TPA: type VI secretion system tube protein Hcp [Thermoanaerobaculia bacterium]|jgi:type VI secretion system secreted protein Hcp|nr:type VI secretion system tube protein Hcp [Thermoanaerobaculia bacterium]
MTSSMYIKFEDPDIDGASTAPGHQGEIEVLSWSQGFGSPTGSAAGSATVEQANHASFNFTKYLDAATNSLLRLSWSGKRIGKATLSCFRADSAAGGEPVKYLTVVMEHVIIANYSVSGGAGDIPVENISLDYGIIQYNYMPRKHAEAMSVSHNLETRTIV